MSFPITEPAVVAEIHAAASTETLAAERPAKFAPSSPSSDLKAALPASRDDALFSSRCVVPCA